MNCVKLICLLIPPEFPKFSIFLLINFCGIFHLLRISGGDFSSVLKQRNGTLGPEVKPGSRAIIQGVRVRSELPAACTGA